MPSPSGFHRFSHAAVRLISLAPRCIGVNRADTCRCTALGSTTVTAFLSTYLDSLTPLYGNIFKLYLKFINFTSGVLGLGLGLGLG